MAAGLRGRARGAGGRGAGRGEDLLDESEQEAVVRELEVAARRQARVWGRVLASGCTAGACFHLWAAGSQLRAPRGLRWHAEAAVPALGEEGVVAVEVAAAAVLAAAARAAFQSAGRSGEGGRGDLNVALWSGRFGAALAALWLGVGLLGGRGASAELAVMALGPAFAAATAWSLHSFAETADRIHALKGLQYRYKKP